MIKFNNAKLVRAGNKLLENVSLALDANKKYGLIGRNGSGKTSFLSLITGKSFVDAGSIDMTKGCVISYMEQEIYDLDKTALNYVLDGDANFRKLEAEITTAEQEKNDSKIAELHDRFKDIDGYSVKSRAQQLLYGLGFTQQEYDSSISSFSGGWRMRLNLAKTLMCRADIILLDEPTNHLDLKATLWLENYLKNFSNMLILISHDRDFLDAVTTHTLHIDHHNLNLYTGNYSEFERILIAKNLQQQALYLQQQKQQEKMQSFIDRFKAKASKAKQAQSRIKALEKLDMQAPAYDNNSYSFAFQLENKIQGALITLSDLSVGYNENIILSKVNLTLRGNSRIGLLGQNGSGKTTLLRTIIADILPLAGDIISSQHLKVGYFSQHQLEALDTQLSPFEQLQTLNPKNKEQELKNFLGGFDFSGEKVQQKIQFFSEGEKSRLALAIICWEKPNLLILDEPTNHLDLETRFSLTTALQEYNGALVLVSHDRNFIRSTVDEFYVINDQKLEFFNGDIDEYKNYLLNKISSKNLEQKKNSVVKLTNKSNQRKNSAELRAKLKPLKDKITALELKIEKIQQEIQNNNTLLADSDIYKTESGKIKIKTTLVQQSALKKQLDEYENTWLMEQDNLENLHTHQNKTPN